MALPAMILALGLMVSSVSAQVVAGPRVAIELLSTGLTSPLMASSTNAVIARLVLDTSGSSEAVRISSLPWNLIPGNGASASTLGNCRVYNETDLNTALNSTNTSTTLNSGINNIAFINPLVLQANTVTALSFRCDIGAGLTPGGTFTTSMTTTNVSATGVTSGTAALVTIRGAVTPPVVYIPPVTPGMPATGATGEAPLNIAMIVASLMVAALGVTYLAPKKA